MVPFQPRGDRPVLCAEDFRKQRDQGGNDRRPSQDLRPSGEEAPAEEQPQE